MALKATVFKATLEVADMDRGHYADYALTIARHPSETDERMMVRILAFALHASPALAFGRGLSTTDEPDIWERDLTGAIDLWVDVGLPDEKLVRRACTRAGRVVVYTYGRGSGLWWTRCMGTLERMANLSVTSLAITASRELAGLAQRTMQLQCTIQEGHVWLGDGALAVEVILAPVYPVDGTAGVRRLL